MTFTGLWIILNLRDVMCARRAGSLLGEENGALGILTMLWNGTMASGVCT